MSIFCKQLNVKFVDEEHYDFFMQKVSAFGADCYLKALIYTIGICPDTRNQWNSIYDKSNHSIKLEVINEGWQTSGSVKVTRLAFQLFTDGTPTAYTYDDQDNEVPDIKECRQYSVSDIFCCSYAPFFVEAIKLRYPEYFGIK
ncbi:DUF6075 family protein [Clostridium minihomine]|uniref:DUF6075 family protein n=1 Tax=Clostridium minihomine TaxID=2045012 RepID=UPI000C75995C|nr:DUF6075 family protein [Clostridium minihomine]